MARSKKTETDPNAEPVRAVVQPKNALQWQALMAAVTDVHWRKLRIHVRVRDRLLAGKPKGLDVARAMLKARDLEDQIEVIPITDTEARAKAAENVVDEGLCEFHRRVDRPGLWFPTNNLKAMIKENWSVLGHRNDIRGSRGALAEGMFLYSWSPSWGDKPQPPEELNWIYLGDKPTAEYTAVAHTNGPTGPKSSIKRHEYVEGVDFWFEIRIAHAVEQKVPDDAMAKTLVHAMEHGMGACRSQGFGQFNVLEVFDVGTEDAAPAKLSAAG